MWKTSGLTMALTHCDGVRRDIVLCWLFLTCIKFAKIVLMFVATLVTSWTEDLRRSPWVYRWNERERSAENRFFFQSNFGLKWLGVNFHAFVGSNSAQILIFAVKYLREPTTRGASPHLTLTKLASLRDQNDGILKVNTFVHGELIHDELSFFKYCQVPVIHLYSFGGGWRPSWWGVAPLVVGSHNHFIPKFCLWSTFRPKRGASNASRTICWPISKVYWGKKSCGTIP